MVPGLYQSGEDYDAAEAASLGIGTIVDLSGRGRTPPAGVLYLHWPIEDAGLPDGATCERIVDLVVARLRGGGRVLVHCSMGLNRSGLVSALAARALLGLTGAAAVERVRSARGADALCNEAFACHLEALPAPAGGGSARRVVPVR
ncbi:hypothetical protein BH18CHL2_BH18CHL2_03420 [soil metagenome]